MPDRLAGFAATMHQIVTDWNVPGIGVGVVAGEELIFAEGYGYRDYGAKLPFTPATLCPIASNTKLFTAVAAGLLVEDGKLTWDQPIREAVPSIRFHSDALNTTVTLRDMLGHRTGITRHDMIWYRSDFTRRELFERLRYMAAKELPRHRFLYNNMMYAAVGYAIELVSGQTWEQFVTDRILQPLGMHQSTFTIGEMQTRAEYGVPYTERRDSFELYRAPYYEETVAMAPAGALISSLTELTPWLTALMHEGRVGGEQKLPAAVLKATLEPGLALPNALVETRDWWELLNPAYGMGRQTACYRGHLLTYHGGNIDGFHSQVSFLPREKLGVAVLVIGDHCSALNDIVSYAVYERLLGLEPTPWSQRWLEVRLKGKQAATEARAKAGAEVVPGTSPSHSLADYAGQFEHPAYGLLAVDFADGGLTFDFHKIRLPLSHVHYDRFDTPDDERLGKWSVNFGTSPQGTVDRAVMSLDQAEATFTRRSDGVPAETLATLAGTYQMPTGLKFQVMLQDSRRLSVAVPGMPPLGLLHDHDLQFRLEGFSDQTVEFLLTDGSVTAIRQRGPASEYTFPRV